MNESPAKIKYVGEFFSIENTFAHCSVKKIEKEHVLIGSQRTNVACLSVGIHCNRSKKYYGGK